MILTEEYICQLYARFKRFAQRSFNCVRYNRCLKFLKAAAQTAYTFYFGFTDDETERLLQRLSEKLKKKPNMHPGHRCVFYDTFSQDAQGLSMQYVDAIIAAGWEMLYITEFGLEDPRSVRLKKTLEEYPKARIITVPSKKRGMAKAQFAYNAIYDYAPDKLFMHIHPHSVEAVTAFYALPGEIVKYQINLTDHTYWVGAGCFDYSFEFREYGASLSYGERGIAKDHIFLLPYYPMMKEAEFKGFPKKAEGKVKIFSGASFYKIIDENDTFFKLNKAILDANPKAVTLFAGGGDITILNGYIEKYGLQDRFIPIGHRNDVFECFENCDIYLSTYPLFGALMVLFAAHAGRPILALTKSGLGDVEEVVCQKHQEEISCFKIKDLVKEATHLINDIDYRKTRGQAMRNCVISIDEFNLSFKRSIESGKSQYSFTVDPCVKPHSKSIRDKIKLENKTKSIHRYLFANLGITGLFICPGIYLDGAFKRIAYVSKRFLK